jgi:predicted GNAT family acetyltransferase
MADDNEPKIEHRPERHRFEATLDGAHGRIEYRLQPGLLTIVHTEIDPALEGRGVAGALVRAALDHARAHGLKVDPECSYARSWMERHPGTAALRV